MGRQSSMTKNNNKTKNKKQNQALFVCCKIILFLKVNSGKIFSDIW
jgi:hypothetical protein